MSASLISTTSRVDIFPGFKTDLYSLITLPLTNNTNPRGPGFWNLNASFLSNEEYIDLIKKTIKEVANENKNNNQVDATLLWGTMKMKIRSSSLYYAKKRNAKMKSPENRLENDTAPLEKRLHEDNLSETEKNQILDELAARKLQREEISIHKTKGAIIRSKARWYNEGEKNTKYF